MTRLQNLLLAKTEEGECIMHHEDALSILTLIEEMAKALQIHVNGTIKQLKLQDPYQAVGYEALKKWREGK